ncbi:MAG: alpha-2-macroglobulin family protein [Bacteroidia bacterium]|nr:alpha-2-macroglobulin family protein [Bacteroidia bacterium]
MKAFRIAFFAVLLLMVSCRQGAEEIKIISKNFTDEIQQQQNLVFRFNKSLVADSIINLWDTTAYINFSPAVKGMYRWSAAGELTFSPMQPFSPSTAYKATFNDAVLKLSNSRWSGTPPSFDFHTPWLNAESVSLSWVKSFTGLPAVRALVTFNYEIEKPETADWFTVYLNNATTAVSSVPQLSGNQVSFLLNIQSGEMPVSPVPVELLFKKGLRCANSSFVSGHDMKASGTLAPPGQFEITHVETGFDAGRIFIHVSSNQSVIPSSLQEAITIYPKVNFTVSESNEGFSITGDFNTIDNYSLTINQKLRSIFGYSLSDNFNYSISFAQPDPYLSFVSFKGQFLSLKDGKQAGLRILNIDKIRVTVQKVFANNILSLLADHRYRNWDGDKLAYEFSSSSISHLAEMVYEKVYEVKNLPKQGGINLIEIMPAGQKQFKGIYLVRAASETDQWINVTKLLAVSDMGIIARNAKDETTVFVNSLSTTAPVNNAEVSFISTNNQVLHTARTNNEGVAVFKNTKNDLSGFSVGMITAGTADDFSYLVFNDHRNETSRFDVGGKRDTPNGLEAYLYFERELYRPGEKVNCNLIVRTPRMMPVSGEPVKLTVLTPASQQLVMLRKNLTAQGAADFSFEIPASSLTGFYTLNAYTGNDVLIGWGTISVEEFMPDRINVKMMEMKPFYTLNDSIKVSAEAINLFGSPAADRNYELDISFNRKNFHSKEFPDYNFNIKQKQQAEFPKQLLQGKTDSEGKLYFDMKPDASWADNGLLQGRATLTVFDETGRPVNRMNQFDLFTQDVFYGIKLPAPYFDVRTPMQIAFAAAAKNGNAAVADNVQIEVVKIDWHTAIERTYGSYRYVSQKQERSLSKKTISIPKSGFVMNFTPNESGEYLVRMGKPGSDVFVEENFYAYGWGSSSSTSFEVNTEGSIDIEFDKAIYKPGDKAKVLFKTPFAGRMLVTVERNRVMSYHYLNTDKKSAQLILPVHAGQIPNVYITATLFRPASDNSVPLTVAHGFKPLMVETDKNKLPLKIEAVDQSLSKTKQTIKLKTEAGRRVEMTVAVVDEGIMQIRNTPSPDAYNYFYQKRALETLPADIYPFLMPEYGIRKSSAGGDMMAALQKRVNPLTSKRVNLVSFWSGILTPDANGEAVYTVDIPQFSGSLRVMAVAWNNNSFGSAVHNIRVADPLVISSSLPRFFSPGDTLIMPVTFSNTTAQPVMLNPEIKITGPLTVIDKPDAALSIQPNQEGRTVFKLTAQRQTGNASVEVSAKSSGKTFSEKTDITIRPPASLQKVSGYGVVEPGKKTKVFLSHRYIPSSVSSKLIIARSPVVQFADQLQYLLDYPYGCAEQTISIAFPQLYYADLVKQIKNKPGGVINISVNVRAAISRLQTMQRYNGSLAYWPGGNEENWWATIYAAHFLIEARQAGYDVPSSLLDGLTGYMQTRVKQHSENEYWFYDSQMRKVKHQLASRENLYSLYVLALAGQADLSSMNYYKSKPEVLTEDSRYLLASSYLIIGDRRSFQSLLPPAFTEKATRETGGSFSSYIRDEALALNALLSSDPGHPQVQQMTRHLSEALRKENYLSTQERAFAFLALGKVMKQQQTGDFTATVKANNKIYELKNEDKTILATGDVSAFEISMSGSGKLYYFWESEGITGDGSFKQEDSYLQVRKSFYDRFGKPVQTLTFNQGDLVVVKITLNNTERSRIENIAIADLLPAGFEIENPRLTALPGMEWIKDLADFDYMDVRDDRIHFFTSISNKTHHFYYMVRAVSSGRFIMGPVMADAMYDGNYRSYHGAGVVTVASKM